MTENENRVHFRVSSFIHECGLKLRLKPLTIATASVIYMRFFKQMCLKDFDPYLIATTSVYLAGKAEEDYKKIRDVINVSFRTLYKNRAPLDVDDTFWALKQSVCQCELFILRVLKFKVTFNHPHKYLLHYLKSLHDWFTPSERRDLPIAATAWSLLRDCYHGNMCIRYKPQHIALAAIHLGLLSLGATVPCGDAARTNWWQVFDDDVSMDQLETIMMDFMDIYEMEASV